MSQLTDTRLDVDPLPGEEVLQVLHSQFHQFSSVRRSLVQHSTSLALPRSVPGQTRGAEHVATVLTGSLATDE